MDASTCFVGGDGAYVEYLRCSVAPEKAINFIRKKTPTSNTNNQFRAVLVESSI